MKISLIIPVHVCIPLKYMYVQVHVCTLYTVPALKPLQSVNSRNEAVVMLVIKQECTCIVTNTGHCA